MALLRVFFIYCAILSTSFVLAEQKAETYGDLYIIDEVQKKSESFKIALEYSNETSNTFQSIHEVILSGDYLIKNYLSVGLQGSMTDSSDRSLNNDIRDKLAESGYRQEFYRPKNTFLANLGIRPLSGRLNFFQKSTVPFEVWLKAGYGRVFYDQPKVDYEVVSWQLNVNSFLYKNLGLQIGIGQEVENLISSDADKLAKFKVRAGCIVKF